MSTPGKPRSYGGGKQELLYEAMREGADAFSARTPGKPRSYGGGAGVCVRTRILLLCAVSAVSFMHATEPAAGTGPNPGVAPPVYRNEEHWVLDEVVLDTLSEKAAITR